MNKLGDKIATKILSWIPDGKIKVEAALRSEKKGKIISDEIKRSSILFEAKNLKDWKNAIALATDTENPSFLLLSELYSNLFLDSHTVSVIESRIYRVLRSKFVFVTESGDEAPEVKALFERPWFEEFLKQVLLSKFTGVKLLEIFHVDDTLELHKTFAFPMEHINPKKGIILKEPGDETGWDYRSGVLEAYYLQIGENNDLGMLADIAPLILAKKLAMGSWLDFIEKFGIPPRYVTTDNMTTDRQDELLQMMLEMVNNHVAVIQGTEKIEIGKIPDTDAHKVFDQMISRLNSEISKRVLGQTMTTESGSSRSQAEVHEKVANDRHESDKLFAQYIINKELIPRLVSLSSFYTPLANVTFDWDESDEMEKGIIIDKSVALTQAGFQLDYKVLALKTGLPIIGFNKAQETTPPAEPTKKKSQ
jgi:phage gp29-like protein